jgi:hypothetical protein
MNLCITYVDKQQTTCTTAYINVRQYQVKSFILSRFKRWGVIKARRSLVELV